MVFRVLLRTGTLLECRFKVGSYCTLNIDTTSHLHKITIYTLLKIIYITIDGTALHSHRNSITITHLFVSHGCASIVHQISFLQFCIPSYNIYWSTPKD